MYTPERFGEMLIVDFLDAMGGYNEAEFEKFKSNAELVRRSTALLWNIQVLPESRLSPEELWPFVWDKDFSKKVETISSGEKERRQKQWEQ